jgi:predicted amidohydrolase
MCYRCCKARRLVGPRSDNTDLFPSDPGGASDPTLATYLQRATILARRGAALVMLPEKIEIFDDGATDRVRSRLSMWARDHHTRLLAGFGIVKPEYRDNVAWLFDRNGELMADYSKQHLVPLVEMRFRPGDRDAIAMNRPNIGRQERQRAEP